MLCHFGLYVLFIRIWYSPANATNRTRNICAFTSLFTLYVRVRRKIVCFYIFNSSNDECKAKQKPKWKGAQQRCDFSLIYEMCIACNVYVCANNNNKRQSIFIADHVECFKMNLAISFFSLFWIFISIFSNWITAGEKKIYLFMCIVSKYT